MARISHLKAFLEAATCGSFVKASSNLNLSESAVSARIKALEGELGERLFHRSKLGVFLNETGKAFLPFAETAVTAWQHGRESVDAAAQEKARIAIGIQQDLWEVFSAEWFAVLKQDHPDLQLRVTCDYTNILCQRVAQNLLDMAVIFRPKHMRNVALTPLTQLSLVLVSDRKIEWSGQLPEGYSYVDWGADFAIWHDDIFHRPQAASLSVSVSGMALSTLQKNGGAAYLLENTVSPLVNAGKVFVIDQAPKFNIDVWIAQPEESSQSRASKPIIEIDLLRELISRNLG